MKIIINLIFNSIFFTTCKKQNSSLFEFKQEYSTNLGQYVKIFNAENELCYIDKQDYYQ